MWPLDCPNKYLPIISVPSGAPSNVVALTAAPTSVNVSWDQLPTTARNGIIITYEVKYSWPLGDGQLGTMYVNTSGTPNQLVLNNLQECVQYTLFQYEPTLAKAQGHLVETYLIHP